MHKIRNPEICYFRQKKTVKTLNVSQVMELRALRKESSMWAGNV